MKDSELCRCGHKKSDHIFTNPGFSRQCICTGTGCTCTSFKYKNIFKPLPTLQEKMLRTSVRRRCIIILLQALSLGAMLGFIYVQNPFLFILGFPAYLVTSLALLHPILCVIILLILFYYIFNTLRLYRELKLRHD